MACKHLWSSKSLSLGTPPDQWYFGLGSWISSHLAFCSTKLLSRHMVYEMLCLLCMVWVIISYDSANKQKHQKLRSDTKMVWSKCFMHLNLGLEFWWVGWWRLKFTKTGKWSEISKIVIPELIILFSSQIFVYIWANKDGFELLLNLVGLLIREIQPQLARQST